MQLQMSCNKIEHPYLGRMDARAPGSSADSPPEAIPGPTPGGAGWLTARGEPSLAGMFASAPTAKPGPFWRTLIAFLGPGSLLAVGFLAPGRCATALACVTPA